jgi:hypothetical protein
LQLLRRLLPRTLWSRNLYACQWRGPWGCWHPTNRVAENHMLFAPEC